MLTSKTTSTSCLSHSSSRSYRGVSLTLPYGKVWVCEVLGIWGINFYEHDEVPTVLNVLTVIAPIMILWVPIIGSLLFGKWVQVLTIGPKQVCVCVKAVPSISMDSDHRLMLVKCILCSIPMRKPSKREHIRVELLKDEELGQEFMQEIDTVLPSEMSQLWTLSRNGTVLSRT